MKRYESPTVSRRIIQRYRPEAPKNQIIRDFSDDEDLAKHLSTSELTSYVVKQDVAGLVQALYNNPSVAPQNVCVYCETATSTCYTHHRGTWAPTHSDALQRELLETAYRIMRRHFNEHTDEVYDFYISNSSDRSNYPNLYNIECWLEELWEGSLTDAPCLIKSLYKK